jgi:hypothetical protein
MFASIWLIYLNPVRGYKIIHSKYYYAGNCGYGEELSGFINAENFLTSYKVHWLAFQEGLCFME